MIDGWMEGGRDGKKEKKNFINPSVDPFGKLIVCSIITSESDTLELKPIHTVILAKRNIFGIVFCLHSLRI